MPEYAVSIKQQTVGTGRPSPNRTALSPTHASCDTRMVLLPVGWGRWLRHRSEALDNGRKGHWGLSGMRERTQNIGAQLNIWSKPGAGTEIGLIERCPAVRHRIGGQNFYLMVRRKARPITNVPTWPNRGCVLEHLLSAISRNVSGKHVGLGLLRCMARKASFDRIGDIRHLWFRGVASRPHIESLPSSRRIL